MKVEPNWTRHCCEGVTFFTAHEWRISRSKGCYMALLLRRSGGEKKDETQRSHPL